MWKTVVSMGRMALLYRYRALLVRCLLCFAIFAVVELVFTKWGTLISQLSVTSQAVILSIYSAIQLVLLVIIIVSFTRPKIKSAEGSDKIRSLNARRDAKQVDETVEKTSGDSVRYQSKIDDLLDTEKYPSLEQEKSLDVISRKLEK